MTTIQDVISCLRQPVASLNELEELISAPLVSTGIPVNKYPKSPQLPTPNTRQLGTLQSTILAHVLPVWEDQTSLCDLYFVPPRTAVNIRTNEGARALVLNGLALLAAPPLSRSSIRLLEKVVNSYSLDDIWNISQLDQKGGAGGWDRALSSWMSIPGKVANALLAPGSTGSQEIPNILSFEEHAIQTCLATERIIWSVAVQRQPERLENDIEKLTHLISKLISTGHFSDSHTSFIPLVVPHVRSRLASAHAQTYCDLWLQITKNLSGPQIQRFTTSLLNRVDTNHSAQSMPLDSTGLPLCKLLYVFLGPASQVPLEVWQVIVGSSRTWSRDTVRGIVGWAAGLGADQESKDEKGMQFLLENTLARWADSQYITRALLREHQYLTSFLVLALGAFSSFSSNPPTSPSHPSLDSFAETILDLNDLDPTGPAAPPAPPANGSTPPQIHPLFAKISLSPAFLNAITTYLKQQDESVRRCGMLVAEILHPGKVNFEDWDGDKEWQRWAAELRAESKDVLESIRKGLENVAVAKETIDPTEITPPDERLVSAPLESQSRPIDTHRTASEPDSDDDSLVGYDSPSPTSSRAPSPTPSELADPTLRRKPIPRPVYLAELVTLLTEAPKNAVEVQVSENFGGGGKKVVRGMGISGGRGRDAEDEKARVEMALEAGAELIRRKRGYGTELEENAEHLVYLYAALQDNFELDQFEEKRQEALVALVACCPTIAAPTIITQFFHHQYSTAQRFSMLNALGIGARELAGLPIPPSRLSSNEKRPRIDFPSKVLPGQAHLQYLTDGDLPPPSAGQLAPNYRRIEGMRSQVSAIVEDLSGMAIARSREDTEAQVPQAVRERALKLGPQPGRGIVPLGSSSKSAAPAALGYISAQTPVVPFSQVAAEHFVAPLINKFWAHLRESLDREAYNSSGRMGIGVRTGTGTGLILGPLVLGHLLDTLSVLLHASRHAPAFLHILGPDAVELALTVGTRPMSKLKPANPGESSDRFEMEAGVLAAALELALTVFDSAMELDGGRVFAMERTELLIGVGQWASTVFEALEKGERTLGRGGSKEANVVRISAGVVLAAQRIIGRWKRSMIMV